MTDLTEKYKAGELEERWYYVKPHDHLGIVYPIDIDLYNFNDKKFHTFCKPAVLAPVPTYDQLQEVIWLLKAIDSNQACQAYIDKALAILERGE
jgi:hypothetical protein